MGVSHVAAALILFAGLVTAGQTAVRASFDTNERMTHAWQAAHEREQRGLQTAFEITQVDVDASNTTTTALNTGAATIDGARIDIVLDGIVRTSQITTRLVESKATDVWAPGQEIVIVAGVGNVTDVQVIDESGRMDVWRQ
jgi:archaellum component FlaF (FlaF/FlaG flagellin family)